MDSSTPILIVDEYLTMSRIIHNLLVQLGFTNVDRVENGVAALERLETREYGLVIADWNLHPISGLDLLRQIRARVDLADVRFLMVTSANRSHCVQAARAAGMTGHIEKPFNAATLHRSVVSVLGDRATATAA